MALVTHCGAELINRNQLGDPRLMNPVKLSPTHEPLPHKWFVEMVESCLKEVGTFEVVHEELGLTKDGARLFGVMGLRHKDSAPDWEVLWAFRNSNDRRFAASAGTGSRVFVCDNLAMSTDDIISHKHTKNIMEELRDRIKLQVLKIEDQGKELEARYDHLKGWTVDQPEADHIMMEACRAGACPNEYLPRIDAEWRDPRHKEFGERSAWSLFNAFTQINRDKTVHFEKQVPRTIALHKVFDDHTSFNFHKDQLELPLAA